MQATERINLHFVAVDEHDSAGADGSRKRPAADHPCAHAVSRAVPCPADDEAIGGQSEFLGGCRRELAGHIFRFVTLAEEVDVQLESAEQFL